MSGIVQSASAMYPGVDDEVRLPSDHERRSRGMTRMRAFVAWLLMVVTIFVLTRLCFGSYVVIADSMAETLISGDLVLVEKRFLSSKIPQTGIDIGRFSVVAAVSPVGNEVIIKRVVGIPGDTLQMVAGVLYLNGSEVSEPWAQPPNKPDLWADWRMSWQRAYLARPITDAPYLPSRDRWGPIVIPAHRLFLLGDNRARSVDSRQLGLVRDDMIIGKAVLLLGSYGGDRAGNPQKARVRWRRTLKKIR